jgi:outer membrane protein TolC
MLSWKTFSFLTVFFISLLFNALCLGKGPSTPSGDIEITGLKVVHAHQKRDRSIPARQGFIKIYDLRIVEDQEALDKASPSAHGRVEIGALQVVRTPQISVESAPSQQGIIKIYDLRIVGDQEALDKASPSAHGRVEIGALQVVRAPQIPVELALSLQGGINAYDLTKVPDQKRSEGLFQSARVKMEIESMESGKGLPLLEDFLSIESELEINQIVRGAAEGKNQYSKPYLKGRKVVELAVEDAWLKAIEKNLSIKASEIDHKIVEKRVAQKSAAFDSVFNLSLAYSRTDTYERSEELGRVRTSFTDRDAFEASFRDGVEQINSTGDTTDDGAYCPNCKPCLYVDGVLTNPGECGGQHEYSVQKEYASFTLKHGLIPDAWTGAVGITKKLSWGQDVGLSVQTAHRKRRLPSLGEYATMYSFDYGNVEYPYGENPWSSSLSLNLTTPLPFGKNFGEFGSFEIVDTKLALADQARKNWQKNAVSNGIFKEVLNAYWNLVRDLKKLHIIIESRKTQEAMAARTERLFRLGHRTTYDKAQAEADLGIMKNREEITWNELVISSNRLTELLRLRSDALVLPVRYSALLSQPFTQDPTPTSLEAVFSNRPDLKVVQSGLKSSKILYNHRKNQARPDITLSFDLNLAQADIYYGHPTLIESLKGLLEPDSTYFLVGIVYRWPVGNEGAKAALRQAKNTVRRTEYHIKMKKNEIVGELNAAASNLKSTERQAALAGTNLNLKEFAYKKAVELREDSQQVSDFEVLRKHRDLINAKLALLNSLVRHRKSHTNLLFARGEIKKIDRKALSQLN